MIQADAMGLYHPENEDQVVELIQHALQNNLQVRVRGAAQSVPGAIFTDGYDPANGSPGENLNILLDKMRAVSFDDASMQVSVGAGCNLGFDPFDPSETSSTANSLYGQLNAKGWAIPNVSDAIHQTVAGFISTGSSGELWRIVSTRAWFLSDWWTAPALYARFHVLPIQTMHFSA